MHFGRWLAFLLCLSFPAEGAALKILAIGDSLTEEYADEASLAGIGGNIDNWPGLLRSYRSTEVNLGTFRASGTYGDWRTRGASANFSFPGFTTQNWINVIEGTFSIPNY